jgi:hypothetical protein
MNHSGAILDHAMKHLSLAHQDLDIQEIPISALPDHMQVFYVEEKESYGNAFYRYVVSGGELFSSIEEESMERLLRKEDYLKKKQFSPEQLVILFRLLKSRMRDTEVIDSTKLVKGGLYEEYKDLVTPPVAQQLKDGSVEVVFWAKHLRNRLPEKWSFTIHPDYSIDHRKEALKH